MKSPSPTIDVDTILEDLYGGELYDGASGAFIKIRSEKQIKEAKSQLLAHDLALLPEKNNGITDDFAREPYFQGVYDGESMGFDKAIDLIAESLRKAYGEL